MKIYCKLILLIILLFPLVLPAQTGTIKGVILDETNYPIENVNISSGNLGTTSNTNGFYALEIPANKTVTLQFTHITYKSITASFTVKKGEEIEFNPVLNTSVEQISTVLITGKKRKDIEGIVTIEPAALRNIPGANPGVENLLTTLPGVSSNNELSTQYNVRGGNFDENLVYVNGVEVYRPFLIRSGQQEGLSFVNSDMVQNVDFSAGGFQAKYGDKLSSVLDITYRQPVEFAATLDANLLGGSLSVEGISASSKFSGIVGARYRDNTLFVKAKETETNYDPQFTDMQTYLTYKFSSKFSMNFLGNIAFNRYQYEPKTRQTNFGTLSDPVALLVFYEGQEKDKYDTYFGALQGNFSINNKLNFSVIASAYHTTEEEYFDILAQYRLGEVNTNIGDENLGEVEFSEGIGGQLNHGRNDLDALISTVEWKGDYTKKGNELKWSIKYNQEDIRDRIVEWEVIDSAGFSINPPHLTNSNNQPYEADEGPIEAFQNVRATNYTKINRIQSYLQWSKRSTLGDNQVWYNAGVRIHNWNIKGENIEKTSQTVFSPRIQFAIQPDWKSDMVFRFGTGLYYQPPFYRELRDQNGTVQPKVKAQKSFHAVIGNEYSFHLGERPFKLTTELYYKNITQVNPYTVENVRIRYAAKNNAKAYAYGLDIRLSGEFVPNLESWFSFGVLKTEQNIDNRGYIARPTDQRLKFAALFQDYIPSFPNFRMFLNLVYNTGLPGGSPSYADPYNYQSRLPDYKRADLGLQYIIVDHKKQFDHGWKKPFKELAIGFEIFNIFDVQNSITNTWVRDVYSKRQYAIPNYLTPRVFNVKLSMKF